MLIRPNMTTPNGEVWADARARAAGSAMSVKHRAVDVIPAYRGTGVSQNGTAMRLEGLGDSA